MPLLESLAVRIIEITIEETEEDDRFLLSSSPGVSGAYNGPH